MVCDFVSRSICEYKKLKPLDKAIKGDGEKYKFVQKRIHDELDVGHKFFLWKDEAASAGFMKLPPPCGGYKGAQTSRRAISTAIEKTT